MTSRFVFVIGGCFLAAASLSAQEESARLDTIVVTASRTPIDLTAAGSSVSVITREEIARRQAVSVADLLRDVPGVAVGRSGNLGAQTQVRIRGSEANHVLVMIDGVEANDPAAGDEFQFEHLMTSGIDRIEVVRGPQSALWGSDAVGGVINIVTGGAAGEARPYGFVEAGSFDTARAAGHVAAAGDTYRADLGLAYLGSRGTNISRAGEENDGYRNGTANLGVLLDLSETTRLQIKLRHTDTTKDFDGTDVVATGLPADADRVAERAQSYLNVAASFLPASPWAHTVRLTYLDTDNDDFADGTRVSALAGNKLGFYYQSTLDLDRLAPARWTFAIDHEREDFRQRGEATPFGDPNQDQSLTTTGYVLEYRLAPVERLSLSASARRDTSSDFDSVTTYRVAAAYALRGDTRVHAGYGTGQKSPTFIERFGFFPDTFAGNPDLRPEESSGWEIGIDRSLLAGRYSLGATYFRETLTEEIDGFVFDLDRLAFTAVNEAGTSHRRGVELSFSGRPSDAVRLTASYTYLDSTEPDAAGRQAAEIRRPRHMAALGVSYAPSARASLNLDVAYNGSRLDTFFPPFPEPPARVELSSYALVELAGALELTDRLELVGRIENLLDEDYEDVLGFATPGIAAYLGLRTRR